MLLIEEKDFLNGILESTTLKILSLGITKTALQMDFNSSNDSWAMDDLFPFSKLKGRVKIPKTNLFFWRAILANTGLAPEPVPPPREEISIIKSFFSISLAIFFRADSADFRPNTLSIPHPKPWVTSSPNKNFFIPLPIESRACLSTLAAKKLTKG